MAWLTNKDTGGHFNTDWLEEEKTKNKQIAENKKQADEHNHVFGKPGTYNVYRAGDIFDSPLGFLSFGMDRSQSYAYTSQSKKPIKEYTLNIKKPLHIIGTDFDDMQDELCKKYVGKPFSAGKTLEEQRNIMKEAADAIYKEGYDSILMENRNILSGKSTYEIGVLNKSKNKVIHSR